MRNAWFYVGKLRESTTQETITRYLTRNRIQGDIDCEELPTKGKMKAFRIGVPFSFIKEVESADFWPVGVLIRRFDFRRGRHSFRGASLE